MIIFDPVALFRVVLRHRVRFVVIGGFAANLRGSPTTTMDLDICYDRAADNCQALADALTEVSATLRGAPLGIPFQLDARSLRMGDSFTFSTALGPLDCLGTPAGTHGYGDLITSATPYEIDTDVSVMVTSLDDLIRMKRAANRPKDRIELEVLAALKDVHES